MSAAATPDYRADLDAVMDATLEDEAAHRNWDYAAIRPEGMPTKTRAYKRGALVKGDCSKGVQFLSWWVPGCPDPMGMHFGAYGNSQTLWARLQHLDSPSQLLVGDIVTFGVDGEEHAARVKRRGRDPLLWSFGHQGAPNSYRLSQDGREAQFLRVPLPTYVPTPADKLRAKATWFAWVAWDLGEGDFRPWGQRNPSVRPDVPKRIPQSWKTRLQKFEANRHRGNPSGTVGLALA